MSLILRWRPVLAVAVVIVVGFVALLWLGQRRLIYFPDQSTPPPPTDVREVTLVTSDGLRLTAWWHQPSGVDTGLAVLLAPGNGGHRGGRLPLARGLAGVGLTVLSLEYRGYGGNPGQPTEDGLARDVRAARDHLIGAGFAADHIVYFGESLGGGVVSELAVEHPPAALVLRSPFVDLAAAGGDAYPFLPVRLLLRDRYPVAENVARITAPLVVIYGTADSIIPAEQSRAVADRAAGPVSVVVVAGADHNDADLAFGRPVLAAVADLVERIRTSGPQ